MKQQFVQQSVNPSEALTSLEYTEADRVYFKNREYYYYEKKQREYINQGSYGQIFNCYRTQENEKTQQDKLCVKILTNSNKDEKQLKYMIQEIKIIQKLQEEKQKFQNLMEIIDCYDGSNRFRFQVFIVMEKYDGDLSFLMNQRKDIGLSVIEQIDAMQQIMNGYSSLYGMDMIHRDLKPKNILYKKIDQDRLIYKISDFGFAKVIKDKDVEQELSAIGTLTYASPQIINSSNFSYKTDIFSIGIIFYQLIFKGKHPFVNEYIKNDQYKANLQQLEQNKIIIQEIHGEYGQQLKWLLENMLTYNEKDRISIEQIKELDLFKIPIKQNNLKSKIRKIIKPEQQNQDPKNTLNIQNNQNIQNIQNIYNINPIQMVNNFLQYNMAKIQLITLLIQHLFQENNFVNESVRIKTFHMQMIIVSLDAIRKIYITQTYGVIKNQPKDIPQQLQQPHSFQQYLHQYQIDQNEQSQQLQQQFNHIISLHDGVDFQYQRNRALNFLELNKNKQPTPQNLIQELCDQFNKLISQKISQNQLQDYVSWLKFFFQKLWLKNYDILERDKTYLTLTYQYLKVMNLESDHPLKEFQSMNLNDLNFATNDQLIRQYVENKKDNN